MGFWKSGRGINGDGWADEMGRCLERLAREKYTPIGKTFCATTEDGDHEITLQEFADLVEFCSRGHIIADIRYPDKDANRPLSKLFSDSEVETYSNRGQIHCPEECLV